MSDPARNAFQSYLVERRIRHVMHGTTCHVHTSLSCRDNDIPELPEDLVIHGDLSIEDEPWSHLPDRLVVERSLYIKNTPITALPMDLAVGSNITLITTRLTSLPDGFKAPGSLIVKGEDFQVLPHGLFVGQILDIYATGVQDLPDDLRVGTTVYAPVPLRGLPDFMQAYEEDAIIPAPATAHERLAQRHELRAFPNIWRMVSSLHAGEHLQITPDGLGGYILGIESR